VRRPITLFLVVSILLVTAVGGRQAFHRLGYCLSEFVPVEDATTSSPYLQGVTATGATIVWWSASPRQGLLQLDDATGQRLVDRPYEAADLHREALDGLQPGQRYTYRLTEDGRPRGEGSFRTDPGPQGNARIAVIGDSGTGSSAQMAVAGLLASAPLDADLLLHTGDVVYRRGAPCFYEERFFDPYAPVLADRPMYAAFGNHDRYASDGEMFDAVFGPPLNGPGPGDRSYAFAYGPVAVTVIDTELLEEGSVDEIARLRAWLGATLSNVDRPWSIAVMHRPAFSTQRGGQKWSEAVRALTPLFAATGVDLVLAGHAHNYERFEPVEGVTYVVTGGGGASLKSVAGGPGVAVSISAHHALLLEATPTQLHLTATAADGSTLDRTDIPPNDV
jgi:3',5'-cyclic AMP phosphodiesterase CpdA